MCRRYYRQADLNHLSDFFQATPTGGELAYQPCYNIAPLTTQPVVRQVKDSTARELVPMRWGLVGFGSKGPDPQRRTFNAREEELTRSDLWRTPFERRRCLIPADGFYDWKANRPAVRFTLSWPEVFAFAGIWDAWKDPSNGTWLQSFAIITTPANELIETISDRMPAIIEPDEYDRWLNRSPDVLPTNLINFPYSSHKMYQYSANSGIENVRNQGPQMLHPQES
jgi:putative SOS response-associated peptidase YedK